MARAAYTVLRGFPLRTPVKTPKTLQYHNLADEVAREICDLIADAMRSIAALHTLALSACAISGATCCCAAASRVSLLRQRASD